MTHFTTPSSESATRERYSAAAAKPEAALCCPVDYDPQYLKAIPAEVIGVDMTDDILEVARHNAPVVAATIGHANVEFRKGRIQDLALDRIDIHVEVPLVDFRELTPRTRSSASHRRQRGNGGDPVPFPPPTAIRVTLSSHDSSCFRRSLAYCCTHELENPLRPVVGTRLLRLPSALPDPDRSFG